MNVSRLLEASSNSRTDNPRFPNAQSVLTSYVCSPIPRPVTPTSTVFFFYRHDLCTALIMVCFIVESMLDATPYPRTGCYSNIPAPALLLFPILFCKKASSGLGISFNLDCM